VGFALTRKGRAEPLNDLRLAECLAGACADRGGMMRRCHCGCAAPQLCERMAQFAALALALAAGLH
jgi:hypothetical protein